VEGNLACHAVQAPGRNAPLIQFLISTLGLPVYTLFVAFSALTLLVGRQEGHPACKKLSGGVLAWLSVWSECRLAYGPADASATDCLLLQ